MGTTGSRAITPAAGCGGDIAILAVGPALAMAGTALDLVGFAALLCLVARRCVAGWPCRRANRCRWAAALAAFLYFPRIDRPEGSPVYPVGRPRQRQPAAAWRSSAAAGAVRRIIPAMTALANAPAGRRR